MVRHAPAVIQRIALVLLLAANIGLAAESGSARTEKVSKDDAGFVKVAANGGMMEVQLGKIAQERASKPEVKEFGRRMQTDHSKANDELKKIAAKKDIKVPTQLEGKQKSTVDKLSKLKGDEFDRAYMGIMVDDHKDDIERFQQEADKGQDPDLRKFAKDHVPILKKHLELAEKTRKQLSSGAK
jgi:putative membrane protein